MSDTHGAGQTGARVGFEDFARAAATDAGLAALGLRIDADRLGRIRADAGFARAWYDGWTADGQPTAAPPQQFAAPQQGAPQQGGIGQYGAGQNGVQRFSPPQTGATPPGWYPSPSDPSRTQWWDGTAWLPQYGEAAPQQRTAKPGLQILLVGAGLLVLGIVITTVSYNMAGPGGTYVATTGLILVGIVQIVRGLIRIVMGR